MDAGDPRSLDSIAAEVEALKERVALLEKQINEPGPVDVQAGNTKLKHKFITDNHSWKKERHLDDKVSLPEPRFSENFIGGKLLNRAGALIVIFAVAYFLKWSFDNNIIGELGRCVLGLLSGVALMAAGQIYQRQALTVFAQGLTGAGIAIIYLSSYAAVNYYHLISPYLAFSLMFITAISSGILSAIENMPGSAVMATVGGFLVPFLMGSHSGQILPLLSYILILDMGILFLAYYRRWYFLDVLALLGTALISVIAYNMDWRIWIGQAFVSSYLILFIVVAAIYNARTRSEHLGLLLLNTAFFTLMSFINLFEKMNDWLGLICVCLAAVYLAVCLIFSNKNRLTPFFKKALLLIALFFALLTAPLQLNEVYCQMAWLAVAAVLLYFSWLLRNKVSYSIALLVIMGTCLSVFSIYGQPYQVPLFNKATLILSLCVLDWSGALYINQKYFPGRIIVNNMLSLLIAGTLFYLLHFDINNAIYYYQTNRSLVFLIPVSWALLSSLLLFWGVRRNNKKMRLYSLLLFGVVILRTLFYDLQQLDIVFKILVLLAVGVISLAVSFFYQKRMKGDAL
ncbi:MAG: DUF2339 domain-containing protein [Syntrophomonas sp.]